MLETRTEAAGRASGASLRRIETLLSSTRGRCNLMRVKTPAQAAAMLRGGSRAPDLILVRRVDGDPRAEELCRLIREDETLSSARFVFIAEEGAASAHEAPASPQLEELELRCSLGEPGFWWAAVSFC